MNPFLHGSPLRCRQALLELLLDGQNGRHGNPGDLYLSCSLRYRNQTVTLPDGTFTVAIVGQEKGVDARIALDIVRFALDEKYHIALIFSKDQDLSEAAEDMKKISVLQNRWIKSSCAFPSSPTITKARGINGTDWIRIDRAAYDSCIDPRNYRPKKSAP